MKPHASFAAARRPRRPRRGRLRWRLRHEGLASVRRRRSAASTARPLVAYSTPAGRLRRGHPAVPEDRRPARACRSSRPTAPRATRAARSRPARRPTSSRSRSSPTSTASSRPASSPPTGRASPDKGIVTTRSSRSSSARATRRTSRPGTTCSSPASRSLTPNPFTSGAAKWNLMAAYGGSEAARPGGPRYVSSCSPSTSRSRTSRAARRCRPSPRARATCCSPTRTRRSPPRRRARSVDYVIPDQTILIENPIAVTDARRRRRPRRSSTTRCPSPAQAVFAEQGLPPGRPGGPRRRTSRSSRRRRGLFTIDDLGGWTKVNDEFFDPEKGSIAKIEDDAGVSTAK